MAAWKERVLRCVTVRELPDGRFPADFRDPATGLRNRRTLKADGRTEAKRQARESAGAIKTGGLLAAPRQAPDGPTVAEAMLRAIEQSAATEETRIDYRKRANLFIRWLKERHPNAARWADVTAGIVEEYQAHVQNELGLSNATVITRMHVVRSTSSYWHRMEPDLFARDVAKAVRFHPAKTNPHEREAREQRKALSRDALARFLAYLRRAIRGPIPWRSCKRTAA